MELLPAVTHELNQSRIGEPAVNQKIFKGNAGLYGTLDHLHEPCSLPLEILGLAHGPMRLPSPLTAVSLLSLVCGQTLLLSLGLTLLAVEGEIQHELGTAVTPAQHERLVAKYAFLMHMGEDPSYRLHPQSGLGQVGVIADQHGRKMAPAVVLPDDDIAYKPCDYAIDDTAPVNAVLRHERVEHILLSPNIRLSTEPG